MATTTLAGSRGVVHVPAANTVATCTTGAPTGVADRVYVTGITCTLGGTAATAAGLTFNLIDGASGGSTILWTGKISNLANTTESLVVSFANPIQTSVRTAATLETATQPAANVSATVALNYYIGT